ncbi:hypothetical protein [Arthrobacter sp. ISL-95]|nr:hypothetical protein [Arthrobacter sp. ISL-95]
MSIVQEECTREIRTFSIQLVDRAKNPEPGGFIMPGKGIEQSSLT